MKHWTLPAIVLAALLPQQAFANHGPATSAGGITVDSAEPLPEGESAFVLREHYTSYENLTRAEIASRADKGGEFDYLRESFITTLGAAYGVTDDFDLSCFTRLVLGPRVCERRGRQRQRRWRGRGRCGREPIRAD